MPRRASNASTRREHDPTRTRSSPYDDDDCEICRALRSGDDAKALGQPLVDHLLARKSELFPDDLRAVGDWEVLRSTAGEWGLRVDAHVRPPSDD